MITIHSPVAVFEPLYKIYSLVLNLGLALIPPLTIPVPTCLGRAVCPNGDELKNNPNESSKAV